MTKSVKKSVEKYKPRLNKKRVSLFLIGVFSGVIITIITSFILNIFPLDKPFLIELNDIGEAPILLSEMINQNGTVSSQIIINIAFKNYGIVPGNISRIELHRSSLKEAPSVELIKIDRSKIYFLQKKKIEFHFIVTNPLSEKYKQLEIYFDIFDNENRFVGWGGIALETTSTPK